MEGQLSILAQRAFPSIFIQAAGMISCWPALILSGSSIAARTSLREGVTGLRIACAESFLEPVHTLP
jgi:hypothetical protein